MIYTRTVCGKSTVGRQGLTRPPPIDPNDIHKGLYNSCTNSDQDMFIIFENSQVYPEYIVYFEETDPFEEQG